MIKVVAVMIFVYAFYLIIGCLMIVSFAHADTELDKLKTFDCDLILNTVAYAYNSGTRSAQMKKLGSIYLQECQFEDEDLQIAKMEKQITLRRK